MYDNYKYYSDNGNKIIAVSSYAGKSVKGVAKCDPNDTFDENVGKRLAAARCNVKVAKKRYARACKEYDKAIFAKKVADEKFKKMCDYRVDAYENLNKAVKTMENVISEL